MARKEKVLSVNLHRAGYAKESPVVREISFHLNRGEIVGLIGPNGSGKSTVIKAIVGLLGHVEGEISFPGGDKTYAYIPEQPVFYDDLTVGWTANFAGKFYSDWDGAAFNELLTRFGVDKTKKIKQLSKGMRMKTALAIALSHRPEFLILDEPTAGLDPKGRDEILGQIKDLHRERGMTIILVSHSMEDIAKLVDRI
ncbi:MAG TPA: ABC transporter ATP-binding protein, partial [Bacillota bacterium]|nr:ABC transporter ATP-binding protein [Bacillota bacterium]